MNPFYLAKKSTLGLAILSSLTLLGCGGGSSTNDSTVAATAEASFVEVERGPVIYAHVVDAQGVKAEYMVGTNQYRFGVSPIYPISTTGGYIDLDNSGTITAGDLPMNTLQLRAHNGEKITLASTLANDSENFAILLALGFSESQLNTQTPSTDLAIAALSDEVFKYCIENVITDPNDIDLTNIQDLIATRIADYQSSGQTALELERELISELEQDSLVTPLDTETAETLTAQTSMTITQTSYPEMTEQQVAENAALIAYSWNEEKMAKELYLNLYDQLLAQGTEIKAFFNVATNSESLHQETMRALLEKYDLNIANYQSASDTITSGYDDQALNAIGDAQFPLVEIQEMYDDLWLHGTSASPSLAQSELEAACMVEVKDVEDLTQNILDAGDALELVGAFQSLRSGSYNHYWAFNNALVKQGVAEGCCVLGEVFCHPEYPQVTRGNQ